MMPARSPPSRTTACRRCARCRTSPRAPASRCASRRRWRRSRSSSPAPRPRSPAANAAAARPSITAAWRQVLRYMAEHAAAPHTVAGLARMAKLSPYHFLRSFKAVTGVTPHQWLLRARLRAAAEKLATTQGAGDRDRARCRVRGPVEFHPHVPRRIRRFAAASTGWRPDAFAQSAIFSKFRRGALAYLSPHQTNGDRPCSIMFRSACATSPAPSASMTRR